MLTPNTYLHCSIMVAKRLQVLGRKKRGQKEQADKGGVGRAWTVSQFLTNLVYHLNTVRLAALPSSCTCICTVLCTIQRCAHILLYWYCTENNHSDTKQIITWNRKYKLKVHVQIYINERLPWIGYTSTSKTTYRSTHFLWF